MRVRPCIMSQMNGLQMGGVWFTRLSVRHWHSTITGGEREHTPTRCATRGRGNVPDCEAAHSSALTHTCTPHNIIVASRSTDTTHRHSLAHQTVFSVSYYCAYLPASNKPEHLACETTENARLTLNHLSSFENCPNVVKHDPLHSLQFTGHVGQL